MSTLSKVLSILGTSSGIFLSATAVEVALPIALDTSIFAESVGNSSGEGPLILAGVTSDRGGANFYVRRGLISFDISAYIPVGAVIDSAELELTIAKVPDEKFLGTTQSLHRVTSDWGAPTGGAGSGSSGPPGRGTAAVTGDATWTSNLFGSSSWSTPGGDFVGSASALVGVSPTVNQLTTWSSLQMAADVQLWLDDPAQNLGWILVGSEGFTKNARGYYSSDNSDLAAVGNEPRLVINYTPVPEPSAVGLILGAAIGLLVSTRRRVG